MTIKKLALVVAVVAVAALGPVVAQSLLQTRVTVGGCGVGLDTTGQGSQLRTWFSEVVIFRPASGLPVRHAWLTLINPTSTRQLVVLETVEREYGAPIMAIQVALPARTRQAINLGDVFWLAHPRADFGLEVKWQTYGAATVTLWDGTYGTPVIVPGVNGCYEAWRHPYAD